jgi:hypothetical protein
LFHFCYYSLRPISALLSIVSFLLLFSSSNFSTAFNMA